MSLGFPATIEEHKLDEGLLLDVKTDHAFGSLERQGQTLCRFGIHHRPPPFPAGRERAEGHGGCGRLSRPGARGPPKKAKDAAEKVRRLADTVKLEPMSAFDRRVVHQALKDDPDVETHSVEVEGWRKKPSYSGHGINVASLAENIHL